MINPLKTPHIETRTVCRDILVHDPAHDKVHVLNATAAHILELCDGTRSPSQIARTLSESTGACLSTVMRDVEAILHDFEALQLLAEAT